MLENIKAEIQFRKAQKLKSLGKFDESLGVFDRALSLNPKQWGIYLQKGIVLCQLRKFDESIECIKAGLKIDPENFAHYMFLGISYFDSGDLNSSLENIKKASSMCPGNLYCLAYINLINLERNTNKNEAIEFFQTNFSSINYEVLSKLTVFCEKALHAGDKKYSFFKKDGDESRRIIERIKIFFSKIIFTAEHTLIRLNPFMGKNKKEALNITYDAFDDVLKGNVESAIGKLKRAVAIKTNLKDPLDMLFELYCEEGNYLKSLDLLNTKGENTLEELLEEGVDEKENDTLNSNVDQELLMKFGYLYYRLDNTDKALQVFKILLDLNPKNILFNYFLGILHVLKKEEIEGIKFFRHNLNHLGATMAKERFDEWVVFVGKRG
jgi:tetratricopeptide (TPR) repeat protein